MCFAMALRLTKAKKDETASISFLKTCLALQYTLKIFALFYVSIVCILQVIGIQLNFVFAKVINNY